MPADRRTVTDVRRFGHGSKRREIFLEGDLWRAVSADVLKEVPLRVGDGVEAAELLQQLRSAEPRLARDRALRLLAAKERSRADIVGRLRDDGYPDDVAEETAAALEATGLVDDVRFAGMLARMLTQTRGYGRSRALRELLRHGLDESIATCALEEAAPGADEAARATALGQRLVRPTDTVDRLAARLARRGFGLGIALATARSLVTASDEGTPDDEG